MYLFGKNWQGLIKQINHSGFRSRVPVCNKQFKLIIFSIPDSLNQGAVSDLV